MRKIILFILLFCFCVISKAQFPITQNLGNANTIVSVPTPGALRASLLNRTFTDTTDANTTNVKYYAFMQIATTSDSTLWFRSLNANMWIPFGTSGGGVGGGNWQVGGNLFPVTASSRNIGTLSPYGGAIGLMTNSVVRAIVPHAGFSYVNDTTSNKPMVWNPTTKEWNYSSWFGSGGGGGGGGGSTASMAMYFPAPTYGSNVNAGYYFIEGTDFCTGAAEFWVRPYPGAQYVISDGYGGIHVLLLGFDGGTTLMKLSGNVFHNFTSAALSSVDYINDSTCHHIAFSAVYNSGTDVTTLYTYIDGVPSYMNTLSGCRRNVSSNGCGVAYIGGSDHNNFKGVIFRGRFFEGYTPYTTGVFFPRHVFENSTPYLSLAFDFTDKVAPTIDRSMGFFGMKHDGRSISGQGDFYPETKPTDSLPHLIADSIYQSPYTGPITPAGSEKILDLFERTDQVPAFHCTNTKGNGTPDLDSTQSGSLGKKRYQYFQNSETVFAGILTTYAYFVGGQQNCAYVTGDSNDQDVRVTFNSGASERSVYAYARVTNNSNNCYAVIANNDLNIYKTVGGITTNLGNFNATGITFSELKLIVSGNTATAYTDGTLRLTVDVSDVPSSNNSGFGSNSAFARIKKFQVF